jgi:hypothetical protein
MVSTWLGHHQRLGVRIITALSRVIRLRRGTRLRIRCRRRSKLFSQAVGKGGERASAFRRTTGPRVDVSGSPSLGALGGILLIFQNPGPYPWSSARKPAQTHDTRDDGSGPSGAIVDLASQAARRHRTPRLSVSLPTPTICGPGGWLASLPEDFPGGRGARQGEKGGMVLQRTNADVIPQHSPHTPPKAACQGAPRWLSSHPSDGALPGFGVSFWALLDKPLLVPRHSPGYSLGKAESTGNQKRLVSTLAH